MPVTRISVAPLAASLSLTTSYLRKASHIQSPPSDAPRLGPPADQDNDCNQEVTVTLQQPLPDEMYYAFSKTTELCTGLGQTHSVNITTGESRLDFTVNVGESGLDTRQEVFLVSWYTMTGVMGPCSNVLMNPTGMHECWGKDTAVAVNCWSINVYNRLYIIM